jgi:hypothetical protein
MMRLHGQYRSREFAWNPEPCIKWNWNLEGLERAAVLVDWQCIDDAAAAAGLN